jgi:5-methylcytosine-specific restriction endonuclease McrA
MIKMMGAGGCNVIKFYDDFTVNTPSKSYKVPAVIILNKFVKVKTKNRGEVFNKYLIFLRDDKTCQYCGTECVPSTISLDHVHPRSLGGVTSWENLVTCCLQCNAQKGSRTCEEIGMYPRTKPKKYSDFQIRKLILLDRDVIHPEWEEYFTHMI